MISGTWVKSRTSSQYGPRSLARRRFPELDLVALWIDDPAEFAVFRVVGLFEDIATFIAEGREQGLKQFLDDKSFRPGLQGYRRES